MQATLAARIDRLPPEDKALLQTAAVVGKDVAFALLQAVAELPEDAVRQGLGRLQAAEFLYETALFPELEFTFMHALTQEVAYGGLLQEQRRARHAAIVRAFEALYPERAREQTGWLTLHAFRGEMWDRAVAYLQQSAEVPTLDGYSGGFAAFDSAGARWWMGDHEHAIRTALRELGAAPHLGGWSRLALSLAITFRIGQAHHSLGEYPQAVEFLRRNVEAAGGDLLYERTYMAGLPSVLSRDVALRSSEGRRTCHDLPGAHRTRRGARATASRQRRQLGLMFWLTRNRLVGSYLLLWGLSTFQ